MQKIIDKLFSNIDTEESRKSFVLVFFSVLGFFVMFLFSIKGVVEHRFLYSLFLILIMIANFINIIIYKKRKNTQTASHILLFSMGFLFLILFTTIGQNGSGMYWFYTFPALAILLTENKHGLIYAYCLLVISFIFVLTPFSFITIKYEKEQLIRFYAVYIVETSLISVFEFARASAFKSYMNVLNNMKEKNEELLTAEEELRVNNEELLSLNESIEIQNNRIQESEIRLKTIIENQGEGFLIINKDGYISFSNSAAEEILQFSNIIKQNIRKYIKDNDFKAILEEIEKRKIGQKTSFELEITTEKGHEKFILASLTHDIDSQQEIIGQIAIFRDITSRKIEEIKLKKLNQDLKKYFTVIEQSRLTILITDINGDIEYTNPFFTEITGYSKEEVIGLNTNILKTEKTPKETFDSMWQSMNAGETWSGELINKKKDGSYFTERAVISPVTSEDGKTTEYVAIKEDITEYKQTQDKLDQQRLELEQTYKNLRDSITYAKTIQEALLTKKTIIDQWLSEYFIFNQPKEVVGGDFYYINKIKNQLVITIADCTGHGIPGAFMTLIGLTYLHENFKQKQDQTAGELLDQLRTNIKDIFKTFGSENNNGMDMSLCLIDTSNSMMQYAGANSPIYIIRNNELIEFEATKNPIGYYPSEKKFATHSFQLKENDYIYLATDGLQDQFGGENNRTFTRKRLKNLFLEIVNLPTNEQENEIKNCLDKWQGINKQVDDITIMGLKWTTNLELI